MIVITAIWTLCILQFRVAFIGNEAWNLVSSTPDSVLKKSLEKIEVGDVEDEESDANVFLYRFTLSLVVSFLIFFAEICLCSYLMLESYSKSSFYLAFAILYKDLILFGIFATKNMKGKDLALFESLNFIPKWARQLERISAFLSAIAFLSLAWIRFQN